MLTKNKAIMAGILLCLGVILISFFIRSKSPYEYLQKNDGTTKGTMANEFLYQGELDDGRSAIFFVNANGNLSCAVLKKTLFSYKLLEISAEVNLSDSEDVSYLYSSYADGNTRRWIDWGVVRSNDIKCILTDGKVSTLKKIESYNFRICYLSGINSEIANAPPSHIEIK